MVLRMTETMKGAFQCMERLLLQELKALGIRLGEGSADA